MKEEIFDNALRLAGWLLAHQIYAAAREDSLVPILCFNHDDLDAPKVVALKVTSDSYDDVMAGRMLISDQGSQLSSWALAYDEDLELSGRALLVEVGGRDFGDAITFVQRYTLGNDHGLKLLGDLELVGQELLPSASYERLESRHWRDLITEGAMDHDLAGQDWPAWSSARDHARAQLHLGEFYFLIPEGWIFRQPQDINGRLITRFLPWEHKGFEPTIIIVLSTFPDQATLEDVVDRKKAELLGEGNEVLKAEISQRPSPSPSLMVGRLMWNGEAEGRSFRAERVCVPTNVPGRFLVLWASSFSVESWESVVRALDAVLASLEVSEGGNAEPGRADGDPDPKPWVTKLWKKLRPYLPGA